MKGYISIKVQQGLTYSVNLLKQESLPALNQARQVDPWVILFIFCQNETQGRGFWDCTEGSQKVTGLQRKKYDIKMVGFYPKFILMRIPNMAKYMYSEHFRAEDKTQDLLQVVILHVL